MSAFGTKRTFLFAPHMSAFGGKADILFALQMSAYDPKRTFKQRYPLGVAFSFVIFDPSERCARLPHQRLSLALQRLLDYWLELKIAERLCGDAHQEGLRSTIVPV
jgi:hypothetical protein